MIGAVTSDPGSWPVLAAALRPIRALLDEPDVTEISINRPGSVFVERLGETSMISVELAGITADWIQHLSERVAAASHQSINERTPLLSAGCRSNVCWNWLSSLR